MDKRIELLNRLKGLNPPAAASTVWAVVKSVEGVSCTVDVLNTDVVDLTEVRLVADETADRCILITPMVGSLVLVGLIEGQLSDLFIAQYAQVDSVSVTIGDDTKLAITKDTVSLAVQKATVVIKKDQISISQEQTEITLKGGKISIKNAGVSLADLFSDLTSLLTSFKVITPVQGAPTPSVSVDPGTTARITALSTKVNQLLQ